MKKIVEMRLAELAAYVQTHLQQAGIQVILSGGSAISFYSDSRYISKDIDLIENGFASRKQIRVAMEGIGFQTDGRYFRHPDTEILVEFPGGPLSVGEELVRDYQTIPLETGTLRVITPHSFRHTVATRLVRNPQVDLVTAATFLGHSRLDTTARYVQLSEDDLAKAAETL